ncbi:MAG: hypothetical protein ACLTE2_10090 [Eubacteriales bacterium]
MGLDLMAQTGTPVITTGSERSGVETVAIGINTGWRLGIRSLDGTVLLLSHLRQNRPYAVKAKW